MCQDINHSRKNFNCNLLFLLTSFQQFFLNALDNGIVFFDVITAFLDNSTIA